ncbi:MAG TPA: type II secretion system protein [Planctomycetota bacterium]|nr:type II secretion system protein [Planctomycetota bacterium]HRU52758.1 type II secretion system protein [Planctomycetota bacterium]
MTMIKTKIKINKAFTLIEIMIAVALLSTIFTMVQVVLMSTLKARDFVQTQSHADRIGSRLLNLMARDIQATYIYQLAPESFVGTHSTTKGDRLDFITNTDSLLGEPSNRSDITEVSYYTLPNKEEAGAYYLLRREDKFVDDKPFEGGYSIILYKRIAHFELKYVDINGKIVDTWNNKIQKTLPQAVIVRIGIRTAPPTASSDILERSVHYVQTCIPIYVSLIEPKIEQEDDKDKDKDKDKDENEKKHHLIDE